MKQLTVFFLLAFAGLGAKAQVEKNKIGIGAGLSLAIPVYNLDISNTGGGADVMAQYGLSAKTAVTADVAFIGLPGKGNYPSTAIVPIRLGIKYFPLPKLYAGAKAGLGIYTILKASASHVAYSVTSGYLITQKIEAGIFYDGYSNNNTSFGYAGIRAGYNF